MKMTPGAFSKHMDDLARRSRAMDGDHKIPLGEMLPDAFIARNTDFATLGEMLTAGGVTGQADIEAPAWGAFVTAHCRLGGWPELLEAAIQEWGARKLGE